MVLYATISIYLGFIPYSIIIRSAFCKMYQFTSTRFLNISREGKNCFYWLIHCFIMIQNHVSRLFLCTELLQFDKKTSRWVSLACCNRTCLHCITWPHVSNVVSILSIYLSTNEYARADWISGHSPIALLSM